MANNAVELVLGRLENVMSPAPPNRMGGGGETV
jgi:hypothetical protein